MQKTNILKARNQKKQKYFYRKINYSPSQLNTTPEKEEKNVYTSRLGMVNKQSLKLWRQVMFFIFFMNSRNYTTMLFQSAILLLYEVVTFALSFYIKQKLIMAENVRKNILHQLNRTKKCRTLIFIKHA